MGKNIFAVPTQHASNNTSLLTSQASEEGSQSPPPSPQVRVRPIQLQVVTRMGRRKNSHRALLGAEHGVILWKRTTVFPEGQEGE